MGEFADKVFAIVRDIPRGKVSTYGQIARFMGRPISARYVEYALRSNPAPGNEDGSIPCHRVIFKDGSLCKGYAFGGEWVQRKMLEEEGVRFDDEGRVVLPDFLWDGTRIERVHSDNDLPLGPPSDFDWEAELGKDET